MKNTPWQNITEEEISRYADGIFDVLHGLTNGETTAVIGKFILDWLNTRERESQAEVIAFMTDMLTHALGIDRQWLIAELKRRDTPKSRQMGRQYRRSINKP